MTSKLKIIITLTCYFSWFAYGVANTIVPTTLLDIADTLNVSFTKANYGFIVGSSVYTCSLFALGFLFEYIDKRVGLFCASVIYSAVIICTPFITSLHVFYLQMALISIVNATIGIVGNYWILYIWKEASNVYMQGLHFSFAVGMAVAPLMSAPYMKSVDHSNSSSIESHNSLDQISTFTLPHLFVPYAVSSVLLLVSSVICAVVYFYEQNSPTPSSPTTLVDSDHHPLTQVDSCELTGSPGRINSTLAVIIAALFMFSYTGVEANCNTFVVEFFTYLGHERRIGAYEASLLFASFSISRFFCIFTAMKLSSYSMLLIHLFIVNLAGILMLLLVKSSLVVLSIPFVIFGIGTSCIFPTIYAYFNKRLQMSSGLTGFLMAASASANIVIQLLNGHLLEANPMAFVYINIATALSSLILFNVFHIDSSSVVLATRPSSSGA